MIEKIKKAIIKRIIYFTSFFKLYILLDVSIGFVAGIIVGDSFPFQPFLFMIAIVLFACFKLFLIKSSSNNFLIPLFFAFLIGLAYINYCKDVYTNNVGRMESLEVEIIGEVVEEPDLKGVSVSYVLSPKKIKIIGSNFEVSNLKGNILVNYHLYPGFNYGDVLKITGKVEIPKPINGFDYKAYLEDKGIYAVINKVQGIDLVGKGKGLQIFLYRIKQQIKEKVGMSICEPHASLIIGILLGIKSSIPESFQKSLQATGTTHIIAISGYNINILFAFLLGFSRLFGRKATLIVTFPILVVFLLMIGVGNIPALRAGILGFITIISMFSGRKRTALTLFPLSVAILLFINPQSFKLLSFQLSVGSTFGLIGFSKILGNKLIFLEKLRFVKDELTTTLSAIVFTLPITLGNFYTFSLVSPLVNILVLPIIPVCMLLGFILIIFTFISPLLANIFGYLVWLPFEYVIEIIVFFSGFNFAMVNVGDWSGVFTFFIYLILIIIIFESNYKKDNLVKC